MNTTELLMTEPLQPLAKVLRSHPALSAAGLNPRTIARWALVGVRGPTGQQVRLEACRAGGKLLTSSSALSRYLATMNTTVKAEPVRGRTPAKRLRDSQKVGQRLAKAGL